MKSETIELYSLCTGCTVCTTTLNFASAELVTLAPGLCLERRFALLARVLKYWSVSHQLVLFHMCPLLMVAGQPTYLLLKIVGFWIIWYLMMKSWLIGAFKIREELMLRMVSLCIPPSKAASMQMVPADERKTSSIANVRIYVEQAMKVFHILKHELPISLLPLSDDIIRGCATLCNLLLRVIYARSI